VEWSVERQRRTRGRSETPTRRTVSGRPCFDRGCVAAPLRTATSASAAASAGPVRDQMPPPLPGGPIHLPPAQHHWPNAAGTSAKWPRPQPNSQPTPMDPVVLRGRAVTTQYPWTSAHFANVAVPMSGRHRATHAGKSPTRSSTPHEAHVAHTRPRSAGSLQTTARSQQGSRERRRRHPAAAAGTGARSHHRTRCRTAARRCQRHPYRSQCIRRYRR